MCLFGPSAKRPPNDPCCKKCSPNQYWLQKQSRNMIPKPKYRLRKAQVYNSMIDVGWKHGHCIKGQPNSSEFPNPFDKKSDCSGDFTQPRCKYGVCGEWNPSRRNGQKRLRIENVQNSRNKIQAYKKNTQSKEDRVQIHYYQAFFMLTKSLQPTSGENGLQASYRTLRGAKCGGFTFLAEERGQSRE